MLHLNQVQEIRKPIKSSNRDCINSFFSACILTYTPHFIGFELNKKYYELPKGGEYGTQQ